MASSEVLDLAKKGDSGAIAAVMNEITQPKGVLVRVQYQGDCLHILFQGAQIPKQQTAVSLVRTVLKQLNIHWHRSVMVYGRQQGSHHTSWHEALPLEFYFELSPDDPMTEQVDEPAIESNAPSPSNLPSDATDPAILSEPELELSATEVLDPEPPPSPNGDKEPPAHSPVMFPMETTSLAPRPETALAETSEIPDFLKRPESIVFIFFTTVFVFWEAYLSLLNELAPETSLSCRQLADRLSVTKSTVRKRKRQAGFSDWSKSLDPDGIAWVYESGGLYRPQD
jgi:hypothetical protein